MSHSTLNAARRVFAPIAFVIAAAACNRSDARAPGDVPNTSSPRQQGSAVLARTIPADTNPCDWVDSSAVAKVLGPLAESPRRGHDASNAESAKDGRACVYTLSRVEPGADGQELVALEVAMKDAVADQSAAEAGLALGARILGGASQKEQSAAAPSPPRDSGWDATRWMPNEFIGRVGHVAVLVRMHTRGAPFSSLEQDSVSRLAVLVRDHVPDIPAAAPRAEWNNGNDRDPCTLLTRAEVESVLGALAVSPYRSNGDTPLADPSGDGCSYYTRRHHVLTIKPDWLEGRTLFRMQSAATRAFTSPVGMKREGADTLDGPWDEAAAGMDGTLYFLKGDRMLSVVYRTAGLSEPATLRLASLAADRLR
jgi:hypothetical protein